MKPPVLAFVLVAASLFATGVRADVTDPTTGLQLFSGVTVSGPAGLSGTASQLVDNSGLVVGGSGVLGAADSTATHLVGGTPASPDYFNNTNEDIVTPGDTLTFDLGSIKLLNNAVFWNFTQSDYNENNYQEVGAQSITIKAGLTLGTLVDLGTFTLAEATGFPTLADGGADPVSGQTINLAPSAAQYVAVTLNSNYGNTYGNIVGLDEVHFEGLAALPEPSTYAMLALGVAGIVAAARFRRLAI